MVMNVLRRKKRNPLLLILLGAVALSFVIFFGTGLSGRRKKGGIGPDAVAVVNGYQIDHRTFENQMRHERPRIERQMEQLRRLITDEDALREQEAQVIKRARLSALENLIDRTLIDQAAQQYDVRGSDNEVRTRIMSDPNFQSGGKFDPNLYRDILGHNRIAPEFYEEDIRHFVSMGRLHSMVTGSVVITDTEVRQEYDRRNDKLSLEYITLDSQAYTEDVEVTPAEVRAYFEQHPEKFIWPDRRQADYIAFTAFDFRDQVEVSEEEIVAKYDANIESMFTKPEGMRVSHILISVARDAGDEVRQGARDTAQMILELAKKPDADFAALAEKYSQDPDSAAKGGSMGLMVKGQWLPEFEEVAFSLEPGEVGGLAETPLGYHIIRVDEKIPSRVVPLEEARNNIEQTLKRDMAVALARRAAEDAFGKIVPGDSLRDFARSEDFMLRDTGVFAAYDFIPNLKDSRSIVPQLFEMPEDEISRPIQGEDTFYIFQVTKALPARAKEFDECDSQAEILALEDKRKNAAVVVGQEMLDKLKAGQTMQELAAQSGLTVKDSGWIKRGTQWLEGLGAAKGLILNAFNLTEENPYPDKPASIGQQVVVYRLKERASFNPQEYQAQEDEIRDELAVGKREVMFIAWVDYLKSNAEIYYDFESLE